MTARGSVSAAQLDRWPKCLLEVVITHVPTSEAASGKLRPPSRRTVWRGSLSHLVLKPQHPRGLSGAVRVHSDSRCVIIASRWNPGVLDRLVEGAHQALLSHGVDADAIDVIRVPGAWELPVLAARLAALGRHAAIIALGCVVRGDTRHYEHVADGCAEGLMRVALEYRVPVLNGVLAVETHADATARAGGKHGNKGEEVALAALEMTDLWRQL